MYRAALCMMHSRAIMLFKNSQHESWIIDSAFEIHPGRLYGFESPPRGKMSSETYRSSFFPSFWRRKKKKIEAAFSSRGWSLLFLGEEFASDRKLRNIQRLSFNALRISEYFRESFKCNIESTPWRVSLYRMMDTRMDVARVPRFLRGTSASCISLALINF